MKRYIVQTMPMHDARIEEYINLHATKNGFELHDSRPFMDEQSMEMCCLITMCREEEHPQQKLNLETPDPHPMELEDPHNETGWMDTIEQSNAMLTDYRWDDCAVEFAQVYDGDMYELAIKDNNGLIIKTHVHLFEWSGYVVPFINDKDVNGMVKYLLELHRIDPREGTRIRGEEDDRQGTRRTGTSDTESGD